MLELEQLLDPVQIWQDSSVIPQVTTQCPIHVVSLCHICLAFKEKVNHHRCNLQLPPTPTRLAVPGVRLFNAMEVAVEGDVTHS